MKNLNSSCETIDINSLYLLLSSCRFQLADEKRLQGEIEGLLLAKCIPFEREYHLSKAACIDFMVDGIGVEVKTKGSARNIFRQCEKYCAFQAVTQFILLTNRSMGLPESIMGKPAYLINLGRAWL
jgi:hypothetical protein